MSQNYAQFVSNQTLIVADTDDFPIPHFSYLASSSNGVAIGPDSEDTDEFVVQAGNYLIIYQATVQSTPTRSAGLELIIGGSIAYDTQIAAPINNNVSSLQGTYILLATEQTTIQLALLFKDTAVTNDIRGLSYGIFAAKVTIIMLG
ncbi:MULTISPECIES: hypothetical protein [unclassified Paenibacillus]|uniref:hypothetical protein n=1 Tax=unclassified Paenibacillus TaxID=185978 RepID=UPI0030FB5ED8